MSRSPQPLPRRGRTGERGRSGRVVVLGLLPAGILALSACGSDTPSMNLGQAEDKVKAYASAALAVLPDKDTVKIPDPLVAKDECESGPANSPTRYMPYISYKLRGIPGPKVQGVFDAVRQRLKQDGFSVERTTTSDWTCPTTRTSSPPRSWSATTKRRRTPWT
ncbi:hypothetical protein [Kitasatospora cathayae]|uniref:Uncharacterized protein n=1 Tax=Kitasatospora cathayae TaxID=3004092 RepID=A0ABY7QGZ7_9ACTN|nr:hypothetical protein [Kitasatospora sp. HUAS 3-15]WBP92085.1 hypothetical protein O1G21_40865 [Kitasatospora sp. HUAS 3-15]